MFCSSDSKTLKKYSGGEKKKKAINKQLKIILKNKNEIENKGIHLEDGKEYDPLSIEH